MKVLFLSFDGVMDPLGRSQILPYLMGLRDHGLEISIISLEKYPDSETTFFKEELFEKHGIKLFPLQFQSSPKGISFLINSKRMRSRFKEIIEREEVQIIHSRSIVPLSVCSSLIPINTKVIFDMRGFWADERVDGKIWNPKNPLFKRAYRKFKKEEQNWIKRADSIITLTHSAKNEIIHWAKTGFQEGTLRSFPFNQGMDPNEVERKTTVIPTCVNTSHFDPGKISMEETKEIKASLGIPDRDLVFGYLGSLGTWYLFEDMLAFFIKSMKFMPNSSWLIISREPEETIRQRIREFVKDDEKLKEISSKIFIKSSDYDEVPGMISLVDLGLYFISTSFSKIASSATKTGEFLAMGKPVITNGGWGDMDSLSKKYPEYIYLADQVGEDNLRMISDPEFLRSRSSEIRMTAETELSLGSGISAYNDIYKKLDH